MSSIIAIQQTDAVHIITDGATYSRDAVILGFRSKVAHLAVANCVFGIRGASWSAAPLAGALAIFDSFDAVAEALPMVMRLSVAEYRRTAEERGDDLHPLDVHFEVTVAGWSDRMHRMAALVASTFAIRDPDDASGLSHALGYVPYTPWLPLQGYSQPPLDWEGVLGRPFAVQDDVDALDPAVDGLALFEAQRNEGGIYDGRAAYLIGGFVELTTVRRDGVERRILREYPDVVGERIAPEGGAPVERLQAVMDAHQALTEANDALAAARIKATQQTNRATALSIAA